MTRYRTRRAWVHILLIVITVIYIFPFAITVGTSFATDAGNSKERRGDRARTPAIAVVCDTETVRLVTCALKQSKP